MIWSGKPWSPRRIEAARSAVFGAVAESAQDRGVGILCAILSVLLFSSFTLASRLGFAASLTFPDLAVLRFGIGGTLLLPVLLRYGLSGVRWRDAGALALLGGVGFALVAYAGFSLAPAAHGAVLLHGTLPLLTSAMLGVTSPQRGARRNLTGIGLIGIGILLMAYDSTTSINLRQSLGDGFLLLASLLWSAYGILARRLGLPPAQGAAIVAVFSMCCFLPVYAFLPGTTLLLVGTRELLLQALVQGVLIGAVSIFVYTRAVAVLGPARTALFTAAVPCITTLAAVPLLSELPSVFGSMGVGAVTAGMIAAIRLSPERP